MSTTLMARAFAVEARPSIKLLLLMLAYNADESGKCAAPSSYLEAATGQCPRTVRLAVGELISRGLVTKTKTTGKQANYNVYQLHLDEPA